MIETRGFRPFPGIYFWYERVVRHMRFIESKKQAKRWVA